MKFKDRYLQTLSVDELFQILLSGVDEIPMNVILECSRRGDAIVEKFRHQHRNGVFWKDIEEASDGIFFLRVHAVMILGLIPAENAGLLMLEILLRLYTEHHQDGEEGAYDPISIAIDGYWPDLFRNKPDNVFDELRALLTKHEVNHYVRLQTIGPLISRAYTTGERELEDCLDLVAGIAMDGKAEWVLRSFAADHLLSYPRERFKNLLNTFADMQGLDALELGGIFDRGEVEAAFSNSTNFGTPRDPERVNPWRYYDYPEISERLRIGQEDDDE